MYDIKNLPATPANARRLIEFAKLNGMVLADNILQLAQENTVGCSDLDGTALELDQSEQQILQRLSDWQGRGMILGDGFNRPRHIALAYVKLNGGPTLVLTDPKFYGQWVSKIQTNFVGSSISVFGNPRYKSVAGPLPGGVEYSEEPNVNADFIISSFVSVVWNDLLAKFTPSQSIVEELEQSYKWSDLINGVVTELPSPIVITNVQKTGGDISNIMSQISRGPTAGLVGVIADKVWCGADLPNHMLNLDNAGSEYLRSRGYLNMTPLSVLPVLGVSAELLQVDLQAPINVYDRSAIARFGKKRRTESGVSDVVNREAKLELATGRPVEEIVARAIAGDETAKEQLTSLRTSRWASLKAASVKTAIDSVVGSLSRVLIVAENPDLIRKMMITLSTTTDRRSFKCDTLVNQTDRNPIIGRYLAPDPAYLKYAPNQNIKLRALNALIVSPSDLDESDLLKVSDYVMLAEWPMDQATFDVINEDYTMPNGARLITSTLMGTFEEHLLKHLINND